MKKYIIYVMSLLFTSGSISGAVFTIQNFTGAEIRVELHLNKSWGSKTIRAKIGNGKSHTFDTGVYGVGMGGITWTDENLTPYVLATVSIDNPLMIGGVIRLFKNDSYEFIFKGSGRGYGNVSIAQ